jgi:hypothetical protein
MLYLLRDRVLSLLIEAPIFSLFLNWNAKRLKFIDDVLSQLSVKSDVLDPQWCAHFRWLERFHILIGVFLHKLQDLLRREKIVLFFK